MNYQTVVGLEVHAELTTKTKIFCACAPRFGQKPNTAVCPICLGYPGTLPTLNRQAVLCAIKAGLALGCRIHLKSRFDRKNYFYPDLPKGYQITQFYEPIGTGGEVEIPEFHKTVNITRIHIEEDAGKLIHENGVTRVDYNRAGVPLIEIVTEPELSSGKEAAALAREIALLLKTAGVCTCKMAEGALRVDVNVSVMPEKGQTLGTRTEIKNLNSFQSVRRAVEYEAKRQIALLESGQPILQQTMHFDEQSGITSPMRMKENGDSYRYFPEPDLPPLVISQEMLSKISAQMPKMPRELREEYKAMGLSADEAEIFLHDKALADYFHAVIKEYPSCRKAAVFILSEFRRRLRETGLTVKTQQCRAEMLAKLLKLTDDGLVQRTAAKEHLLTLMTDGGDAAQFVGKSPNGCDEQTILTAAKELIQNEPQALKQYREGSEKVFGFFVGSLMHRFGKDANPKMVSKVLKNVLDCKAEECQNDEQ